MRKTRPIKLLSVLLMLAMAVTLFAACTEKETTTTTTAGTTTTKATTTTQATTTTEATTTRFRQSTPLVVGYSPFSEKFSPFFADTAYDNDVVSMTAAGLLTTDRTGAIVYNAIEGEKLDYNGTEYEYKGIAMSWLLKRVTTRQPIPGTIATMSCSRRRM